MSIKIQKKFCFFFNYETHIKQKKTNWNRIAQLKNIFFFKCGESSSRLKLRNRCKSEFINKKKSNEYS